MVQPTSIDKPQKVDKAGLVNQVLQRKILLPLVLMVFLAYSLFFFSGAPGVVKDGTVQLKKDGSQVSDSAVPVPAPVDGVVPANAPIETTTTPVKKKEETVTDTKTPSPTNKPSPSPTKSPVQAPTPKAASSSTGSTAAGIKGVLERFQESRQAMITKMEFDYGKDNLEGMIMNQSKLGIRPPYHATNGPSWARMRRKMMIRLLEAHEASKTNSRQRGLRSGNTTVVNTRRLADVDALPKYVWATGGHSATAAHGNLWRESYTAVLERTVKDLFSSVGLNFIGRNHAMGGTSSGPEIALCGKEIFGNDLDVLVWDTGMTDGGSVSRIVQYFLRAGIEKKQPAMVALHPGNRKTRRDAVRRVEDNGLAAFLMFFATENAMDANIPDTLGKTDEEIAAMPEFVRQFRCGKRREDGDPGCGKAKWNTTMCARRSFKTSWHPGWKWHAMNGNFLAMWISHIMEDALNTLVEKESVTGYLDQLRTEEKADYDKFLTEALPNKTVTMLEGMKLPRDVDKQIFFKGSNFCHSARLPAEIRHLGILTETDQVGEDSYEQGVSSGAAERAKPPEDKSMFLVSEGKKQDCPVPLNKDYKDHFYVHNKHGWLELTLPNESEKKAYDTGRSLTGYVVVCFTTCNWGKCPKGNFIGPDFEQGKAEMEVNGVKATSYTKIMQNCNFVGNAEGHVWKPNEDGKFQIRAKTNEEGSYLRFSSIAVF